MQRLSRPVAWGALVGFGGVLAVTLACSAGGDAVPVEVPLLLLLMPISAASALAGWRLGTAVAAGAATLYALFFLEPIGRVQLGLTHDIAVLAVFVGVSMLVGLLVGRRSASLADLDDARAMLLRSVSHDLRAPLNTIRMISTDLLERCGPEGVDETAIGLVVDETERLDRIVGNLLSYSRVHAGTFAPSLEPVAPAALVRRCVSRMERVAAGRLRVDLNGALPDVLADAVQIDQVLTNLVENSLRYGPADGPVVIAARPSADGVEFAVSDAGPGVPPRLLAGDAGPVPPRPGSAGLGLSVCRAIVAAHGAQLRTGHPSSSGSSIGFVLPAAHRPHRAAGIDRVTSPVAARSELWR